VSSLPLTTFCPFRTVSDRDDRTPRKKSTSWGFA